MHHDIEQYVHDQVVYIYLFHIQEFLLPRDRELFFVWNFKIKFIYS
jgi:hypothetical protein